MRHRRCRRPCRRSRPDDTPRQQRGWRRLHPSVPSIRVGSKAGSRHGKRHPHTFQASHPVDEPAGLPPQVRGAGVAGAVRLLGRRLQPLYQSERGHPRGPVRTGGHRAHPHADACGSVPAEASRSGRRRTGWRLGHAAGTRGARGGGHRRFRCAGGGTPARAQHQPRFLRDAHRLGAPAPPGARLVSGDQLRRPHAADREDAQLRSRRRRPLPAHAGPGTGLLLPDRQQRQQAAGNDRTTRAGARLRHRHPRRRLGHTAAGDRNVGAGRGTRWRTQERQLQHREDRPLQPLAAGGGIEVGGRHFRLAGQHRASGRKPGAGVVPAHHAVATAVLRRHDGGHRPHLSADRAVAAADRRGSDPPAHRPPRPGAVRDARHRPAAARRRGLLRHRRLLRDHPHGGRPRRVGARAGRR